MKVIRFRRPNNPGIRRGGVTISHDHYQILNVPPDASAAEIKAAFRALALVHHPDQNHNSAESQARFAVILNAWTILGDPVSRKSYDDYLRSRHERPGFVPVRPPPARHQPRPRVNTADLFHNQLNSLLWDIEDLMSRNRPGDQTVLLEVLAFIERWVLVPAGFRDHFMDARQMQPLHPLQHAEALSRPPAIGEHLPFVSLADYFYDIRKRMNRFLERFPQLDLLGTDPESGRRLIDCLIDAQNYAQERIGQLRHWTAT